MFSRPPLLVEPEETLGSGALWAWIEGSEARRCLLRRRESRKSKEEEEEKHWRRAIAKKEAMDDSRSLFSRSSFPLHLDLSLQRLTEAQDGHAHLARHHGCWLLGVRRSEDEAGKLLLLL